MTQRTQEGSPRLWPDAVPFDGFGPSRFRPAQYKPITNGVRGHRSDCFKSFVRESSPRRSGVYGMLDGRGRVAYIGKAKNLRARLLSYFRPDSRNPKAGKIIDATRQLVWEETHDEFTALLRELELIRQFRPRFNVVGMPGPRRYLYLCLGRSPAPYAYLAREPNGKEVASYGPLVGRAKLNEAVRKLNDWFGLRDCSQKIPLYFADQPELFPVERSPRCLRHELQTCLGPCVGACSRGSYKKQVRQTQEFLDGVNNEVLLELTAKIQQAAELLQFEKAVSLRDRLKPLAWLDDRLTFLRNARRMGEFVYPCAGSDGRVLWLLIHRGEVVAVCNEPRSTAAKAAALQLLDQTFRRPASEAEITYRTVDSVLLVHAWFRKHPEEKAKLLTKDQAAKLCSRC